MSNEIDKSPESHATESNDSNSENNSTPLTSMLRNGIEVEKRLKQELLDLGILDIRDFPVVRNILFHINFPQLCNQCVFS